MSMSADLPNSSAGVPNATMRVPKCTVGESPVRQEHGADTERGGYATRASCIRARHAEDVEEEEEKERSQRRSGAGAQ